jgi:hypothetical protein
MSRLVQVLGVVALSVQGCIIYNEGCTSCGWQDRWDDCDGWRCGGGGEDVEPDPDDAPEYAAWLDPDRAERGQTFLAHLYVDGDIEASDVASVRLGGGVRIKYVEVRNDDALLLVEVPLDADLGFAELAIRTVDEATLVFPDALFIGEVGSGDGSGECP